MRVAAMALPLTGALTDDIVAVVGCSCVVCDSCLVCDQPQLLWIVTEWCVGGGNPAVTSWLLLW